MTDDAYLFLADHTAGSGWQGTPVSVTGELECLQTPAVRAWLGAHQTDAASPALRVAPPEQTGMIPEGAERLPVPLTEEELDRVRRAGATDQVAAVEKELLSYRDSEEGRDALLHKALAAGVPAHRIVELSGVDPTALPTTPRT
ncbi:hypothetical protein K388_06458 [Streptomyces sp. KhCrAH-43]|uniref:DUF6003 family protein n=1 Tax=unclassified Streptomyces TaxID=2593676 RepID=UPI000374B4CA|nr:MULTISPECIES: DUF6003 family protein [unclassified Streptomyces]MYS34331.1 hypothetical protein [Streptomyces sp. SID4920]MYX68504.1 hypothetical protein [Streptomyces sp. SID8373]RAJ50747.1 hypothetical protein K388_06458 [Streptomyces sp. KhCrAH-43]